MKQTKSTECLKHLRLCPEFKGALPPKRSTAATDVRPNVKTPKVEKEDSLTVIYKLVRKLNSPDGQTMPIYVGKTIDPKRRYAQHASRRSECRLVRNAFRKYGKCSITMEVIMRCRTSDADVNEAFWMQKLDTLLPPHGCNVTRGCRAGEDTNVGTLTDFCTEVASFANINEAINADIEALADVSRLLEEADEIGEEDETTSTMDGNEAHLDKVAWRDAIRLAHPDHSGNRVFTSDEVTAMLNSIKKS